ncbi:TPA: helix-turn-helix transcriptional regulator [Staphylococcus aureus]|uniref:helix-turn-helix domain-containing protein n=1 Tax=Staphylococcaceae TaxID=90964 RepID=UPI0004478141|nr:MULTISPECIES: helix-turn-helix transcriptional regulator [Staphylococcus]MBO3063845.1 helix-turn-helix transcriptional regulator [Mammaliicoccus fleurettii]EGQ3259955.1 helix-turn-helix transcriptional regulator [Staphylococcus pseudintermedius]EGQ3289161.1 helix-turn-helix transcriptional regulator [Staphylococcus pseudintermedius]EGQ4258606.1 helix-turn-helix transcriptional regulator [Staphylococcus pseudintermedius]EJD5651475.1 helix-turn-helix transcriptional regulator [Staphylococcus 
MVTIEENIITIIGSLLKEIRKDKGFMQKDVAESVGITRAYLNKIENQKNELYNLKLLTKLCALYNVKLSTLVIEAERILDK